jgi:hypothetical protein
MSEAPKDSFEFWTRFVCAFVFFGIVLGLVAFYFLIDHELVPVVLVAVVVNVLVSWYTACHGDKAWEKVLGVLGTGPWWS